MEYRECFDCADVKKRTGQGLVFSVIAVIVSRNTFPLLFHSGWLIRTQRIESNIVMGITLSLLWFILEETFANFFT